MYTRSSSFSSKTTPLYLTQGPAAADVRDSTDHCSNRQSLEKVPARVVEEENTLHGHDASKEEAMCQRVGPKCLSSVIKVSSQKHPSTDQCGKRDENRERKEQADNLWRRSWICSEDVVDLRLARVALWWRWYNGWTAGIGLNLHVKGVAAVWCRRAKRRQN